MINQVLGLLDETLLDLIGTYGAGASDGLAEMYVHRRARGGLDTLQLARCWDVEPLGTQGKQNIVIIYWYLGCY